MANFVLVVNQVPIAGLDKIMGIVSSANGAIKFIPNNTTGHTVTTPGMSGPDNSGSYNIVRLEFDHAQVGKAAEILKIFEGLPK
jgi:hypothetical protein